MSRPHFEGSLDALIHLLEKSRALGDTVEKAASLVTDTLKSGHKLLVCGNGGSAADAMHLATEFVCRFNQDRRPYPAICLNASGADLTAIGNDYHFEQAFARQVDAFGRPGDLLIAFSSSGNSRNILLAIEAATKANLKSIALLGKDGGAALGRTTIELVVPGNNTARIQEVQKLLLHTICEIAEYELAQATP